MGGGPSSLTALERAQHRKKEKEAYLQYVNTHWDDSNWAWGRYGDATYGTNSYQRPIAEYHPKHLTKEATEWKRGMEERNRKLGYVGPGRRAPPCWGNQKTTRNPYPMPKASQRQEDFLVRASEETYL